jgi:hypothetical protein
MDAARLSSWTYPSRRIPTAVNHSVEIVARSTHRNKRTFPEMSQDSQTSGRSMPNEKKVTSSSRPKKSREDIEVAAFCGGAQAG